MQVSEFMKLNNLKKVNQDYANFLNENNGYEDKKLILKWEGFVSNHCINGSGRNGASNVVDFQTIVHECKTIDIVRWGDSKYNSLEIFIHASAYAGQGGRSEHTRVRLKHLKTNKIHVMDEFTVDSLIYKFGRQYETLEIKKAVGENVVSLFNNTNSPRVEISQELYSDLIFNIQYDHLDRVQSFFKLEGFEFMDAMTYTHKFSVSPDSIKVDKDSIQIAVQKTSTYNSLPELITIEKVKEIKTLSLFNLGIESPGSYMHYDKMEILSEQKNEVMNFKKKFDNLIK